MAVPPLGHNPWAPGQTRGPKGRGRKHPGSCREPPCGECPWEGQDQGCPQSSQRRRPPDLENEKPLALSGEAVGVGGCVRARGLQHLFSEHLRQGQSSQAFVLSGSHCPPRGPPLGLWFSPVRQTGRGQQLTFGEEGGTQPRPDLPAMSLHQTTGHLPCRGSRRTPSLPRPPVAR